MLASDWSEMDNCGINMFEKIDVLAQAVRHVINQNDRTKHPFRIRIKNYCIYLLETLLSKSLFKRNFLKR